MIVFGSWHVLNSTERERNCWWKYLFNKIHSGTDTRTHTHTTWQRQAQKKEHQQEKLSMESFLQQPKTHRVGKMLEIEMENFLLYRTKQFKLFNRVVRKNCLLEISCGVYWMNFFVGVFVYVSFFAYLRFDQRAHMNTCRTLISGNRFAHANFSLELKTRTEMISLHFVVVSIWHFSLSLSGRQTTNSVRNRITTTTTKSCRHKINLHTSRWSSSKVKRMSNTTKINSILSTTLSFIFLLKNLFIFRNVLRDKIFWLKNCQQSDYKRSVNLRRKCLENPHETATTARAAFILTEFVRQVSNTFDDMNVQWTKLIELILRSQRANAQVLNYYYHKIVDWTS